MNEQSKLSLKPSDKPIEQYYRDMKRQYEIYFQTRTNNNPSEGVVEPIFLNLLSYCSKQVEWNFEPKKSLPNGNIPDGSFLESKVGILPMGYMESKDDDDDLDEEIEKKILTKDYPDFNILFWQPKRAVLIQRKKKVYDEDIADNPESFIKVLEKFFNYEHFDRKTWEEAIDTFDERMPILAKGLLEKIEESQQTNELFIKRFDEFYKLCTKSINPNVSRVAIKEMIVQHLLTERILESIFDLKSFTSRNIIAKNIESVIDSMTKGYFNKTEFLGSLDHFYDQIVKAAYKLEDFKAKQVFLNDIFERFFQGWAIKSADRLGIVYTPQPVVNFMVRSVDEILKTEFDKKQGLGSEQVHIIDPFVGTGNFIVNVIEKINPTRLKQKYLEELHCNEIQLMPYYIANINIEHAYYDAMGEREPFPGICFADTFQMFEEHGGLYFNDENAQRVIKQSESPIFVVICNPPYNSNQQNEMDNNKNRKYPKLEEAIGNTFGKDSRATKKNAIYDPYVKAIKWASERIGDEGVIAMITNNSFIDGYAFDGMRKHLEKDFDKLYVLDLKGNIRKDSMRDGIPLGEKHTVFGLSAMVGISISFFIKNKASKEKGIWYFDVPFRSTRIEKFEIVYKAGDLKGVNWKKLTPSKRHLWLTEGMAEDFEDYPLMGDKRKKGKPDCDTIFNLYSRGVATGRDIWVYNFSQQELKTNLMLHYSTYETERIKLEKQPHRQIGDIELEKILSNDESKIKWTVRLKESLKKNIQIRLSENGFRKSIYRPYCRVNLYFDHLLNQRRYQQHRFFPTSASEEENRVICTTAVGNKKPFQSLISKTIPDLHFTGDSQCFPFYTYNKDGTGRRENITDHTLKLFHNHYKDTKPPSSSGTDEAHNKPPSSRGEDLTKSNQGGLNDTPVHPPCEAEQITKWDIFYYIYAMLHHKDYRKDYEKNLKGSLPRIPFAPDFWSFSSIGKRLADIHLDYENADIYELEEVIDKDRFPDVKFTVDKMKITKDKKSLVYNKAITLAGIPPEVYEYKLGNRSALEWIVDQYRVKTDKRSGIKQDPNNFDGNERYIFDLIGKVVTVSLETVKLVNELSKLPYK
jgi:predicted helicase